MFVLGCPVPPASDVSEEMGLGVGFSTGSFLFLWVGSSPKTGLRPGRGPNTVVPRGGPLL